MLNSILAKRCSCSTRYEAAWPVSGTLQVVGVSFVDGDYAPPCRVRLVVGYVVCVAERASSPCYHTLP